MDLAGLGARLEALKAAAPDPRVYLGGDEGAQLGRMVAVLDLVRSHGILKVAIETKTKRADEVP